MTARTIKMEMNWKTAAEIYMAALEGGTGEGWKAARAEIRRMAEMLDAIRDKQQSENARSVDLWEVIAEPKNGKQSPFGLTFHDEAQAAGYARAMRRAGYRADLSPVFATQPSREKALEEAARFFEDASLKEGQA